MLRRTQALLGAAALASLSSGALAARPQDVFAPAGHMTGNVSPAEAVLYDNVPTGTETVFTTTSAPRTTGADEVMISGPGAQITSMQFGFSIASGGPSAFDARVRIWDDIDFAATSAASVQFTNLVKDFTVSFTNQTSGAFISSPVAIPSGGAAVTSNPANLGVSNITDAYVQLSFYQPGTTIPVANNGVTFLFFGSRAPSVGTTFADPALGGDGTAASEIYWRDASGNDIINGDEARNFAAPNRANFVLHLEGTVVPEPATMSLLGLGSLGILARRRRA